MSITRQHSTKVTWRLVPASLWERVLCKVTFGLLGRSAYVCRDEFEVVTYYPSEHLEGRLSVWDSKPVLTSSGGWTFPSYVNCKGVVMSTREINNA